MSDITTETISTHSVLRVLQVYDGGSAKFIDDDGNVMTLPAARLRHIANLTEGDEVEMRLELRQTRHD